MRDDITPQLHTACIVLNKVFFIFSRAFGFTYIYIYNVTFCLLCLNHRGLGISSVVCSQQEMSGT